MLFISAATLSVLCDWFQDWHAQADYHALLDTFLLKSSLMVFGTLPLPLVAA